MMGPTYFREFDISSQFRGYGWAMRELGYPADGVIVNALGIRAPTKTGKQYDFQRHTVSITTEELDEWYRDTCYIISDILSMFLRNYFPRHTKWCVGKYGTCQFFNVCTLSADQRPLMLSTGDYKQVTWDPLADRKV